ncbi:MAG TPA: glycerol-3-phosphate dehydrogenase/oxidase [Gaiellaceae bacterium]
MEGSRATRLERLRSQRFDLLVIGGGIIGAGVAELASRHGFTVALVERGDFASGTSSASSKLVHGGLRYLRMGHFGLVREALDEVRALSEVVAPHLVRPLRFVLPVYRGGPYGRIPIRGALWSYAGLTGSIAQRGRMVAPSVAAELVPPLRRDGLRAAGVYADAQTDDARLTLANIRGAADAGGVVLNRAEVVGLGRGPVAEVRVDGSLVGVSARAIVNATGAWIDEVRRLEDPAAGTSVTLSKGSHLVVERRHTWSAAVTIPVDTARVAFAIPWAGALLLGTTDTPFDGDLDDVLPSEAEEQQILDEVGLSIDLPADGVCARFAGVRVLPNSAADTLRAPRETTLARGRLGVLSVAGGKLTTYRRIALAVLHALRPDLQLHRIDRRPRPLPGATDPEVAADALLRRLPELPAQLAERLALTYGTLAKEVLDAGPLEPLADDVPETEAEVLYAREREWAMSAEDVVRRRTTLTLTGRDSPAVRDRVEKLLRL